MHWILVLLGFVLVSLLPLSGAEGEEARRRGHLEEMLRLFPRSEPWEAWLEASGELPPDFAQLKSVPFLPDPLRTELNPEVKPAGWPPRRDETLQLLEHYFFGHVPREAGEVRVAGNQSREEAGAYVDEVTIEFGPSFRARLRLELIIPKQRGPFPVFLTPLDQRQWGLVAVSRGYIACVYSASELQDDTGAWRRIWPKQDWGTLARRSWAASRCVDYLLTLPFVDQGRVALVGHGANGVAALLAAAMDPRIKAVVASSSGVGGACSFRLFSEKEFGDGIELITRRYPDWFHPRLRFYVGRENHLPVDTPQVVACIAPRACLLASGVNDGRESVWAVEHTYRSARRVYDLLGKGQELNLTYRSGGHDVLSEDIETYVDWLDTVFGRRRYAFPNVAVYPLYSDWKEISGEELVLEEFPAGGMGPILDGPLGLEIKGAAQWMPKRDAIRVRMLWGLGLAPPFGRSQPEGGGSTDRAALPGRAEVPEGIERRTITIGNQIATDLYLPVRGGLERLPVVVWVHPISVASGYEAGRRRGDPAHLELARRGYAVLAFDQLGNGSRLKEVRNFYPRYPHWSIFGKQVEDTLAAVESLLELKEVDPRRIYLLGYGTGARVALHAAALEDRVAGVVAVGGVTSMRRDGPDAGGGGVARTSIWMPLQPRLGAFLGEESRIPYDYHEVLGMMAPRPAAVLTPRIDHQSRVEDVKWCVDEAMKVYALFGSEDRLQFHVLDDYHRFSPESQQVVFEALRAMMAGAAAPDPPGLNFPSAP